MEDYPLAPLDASCNRRTQQMWSRIQQTWCCDHGCPLVMVAPNVWDCPMGVLEALANDLTVILASFDDGPVPNPVSYARAGAVLAACPTWPDGHVCAEPQT